MGQPLDHEQRFGSNLYPDQDSALELGAAIVTLAGGTGTRNASVQSGLAGSLP